MPEEKMENPPVRTPAGFTPRTGGLASEYAREMGWGLNEPERAKEPEEKQDADGAAGFGDTAKDASQNKAPTAGKVEQPVASQHKPPIIIIKADRKPTPKPELKPRKKIA